MEDPARPPDTTAAEAYERFMVPALFGPWVEDVVALALPQPGERVLDVACGTGTATRFVGERVAPSGRVVGLDIDPAMLLVARSRQTSPPRWPPAWFRGSALAIPFRDRTFDVVVCLQGLQFFPDRAVGLREMRRVLTRGGRLAASVWRTIEHCRGHAALADALRRHGIDTGAVQRPFSLGAADELRRLAHEAGFAEVHIHAEVKPMRFPSARRFVESLVAGAPSSRQALARVPEDQRRALIEEVEAALRPYVDRNGLAIPYGTHVLSARP